MRSLYLKYLILPYWRLWKHSFGRKLVISLIRKYSQHKFFSLKKKPLSVQKDKYGMIFAIIKTLERAISEELISQEVWNKFIFLLKDIFVASTSSQNKKFEERYGRKPPAFIAISLTNACNLSCYGCYANASNKEEIKLPFEIVCRIIREIKELWGAKFVVLLGGEPFFYKDKNKGILELAEENQDVLFLVFTNGTLIDDKLTEKLVKLGNITPAISVEGWQKETDSRRGKGVFDKVEACIDNLSRAGIPFGLSITVTKNNAPFILSDEFINYYIFEKKALYFWLFHYMPIGRNINLELMPSPSQRINLWKRTWELIHNRHLFIADFWNCGTATGGCISAGRSFGYIYIDHNGNILPCVFNPYYNENIKDIYAKGGDINTALDTPLLESIRNWQNQYKATDGNLLLPCPIRDHFEKNLELIKKASAKPQDNAAKNILEDTSYISGMKIFDEEIRSLSQNIWELYE